MSRPRQAREPAKSGVDNYRSFNALAESQIGLYKSELIHHEGPCFDVAHVEAATAEWVSWFNTDRIHGALDDLTPIEVEQIDYAHHQPLETVA